MEGVKRSDIEAKYEKILGYPAGSEELDLYIFEQHVKPNYYPSEKPWSMVIGAQSERAVRVIKQFHNSCYNILHENNRVIACNKKGFRNPEMLMDDYDYILTGESRGDATHEFTWAEPFLRLQDEFRRYDFSFVRNPDLIDMENWSGVFRRALEYTRPEGALVTIIREDDAKKYEELLKALEQFGTRPVYSGPTGIVNDRPESILMASNNFHHTIGIFKSNQK